MIPIYRAKKIDSDEWIEGIGLINLKNSYFLLPNADGLNFILLESGLGNLADNFVIDQNTLSINFPNMIDKNGKRIFASLDNDNGIGGDELHVHVFELELGDNMGVIEGEKEFQATSIFNEYGIGLTNGKNKEFLFMYSGLHEESIEIIGIHKGE